MSNVEILLVEDNPDDLEMTLHALREGKVASRIHVARDGAEALDYVFCEGVFAARTAIDMPRMILLDLKLPKVDGKEVLERVKSDARTRRIPVVVLTSSREQRDIVDSFDLGVNSYIVKPVTLEQFSGSVQQMGLYWLTLNERQDGDSI